MNIRRLLLPVIILALNACGQKKANEITDSHFDLALEINQLEEMELSKRQEKVIRLWQKLKEEHGIPYTTDSTAFFLYRSDTANSISFNGDFNRWGQSDDFNSYAKKITGTDFWYLKAYFPADARLDYKVVVNEQNWILDTNNPQLQYSGFGSNSFLAMPEWKRKAISNYNSDIDRGELTLYHISSKILSYQLAYQIYLPSGYGEQSEYPVIYVTDAHEYTDLRLGAMVAILDNMIAQGLIKPVIAVFMDPRDPLNTDNNRRESQYTVNHHFLNFITEELIPVIDSSFKSNTNRAILGTSLGGLNSSFFAAQAADFFNLIAVQSPAYWYNEEIFRLVREAELADTRWFITAGTFYDGLENAQRMKDLLKDKGVAYTFKIVNEGHSWGAWSQQLDEILLDFFGNTE